MGAWGSGKGSRRGAWRSKKIYVGSLSEIDVPAMVKMYKNNPLEYFILGEINIFPTSEMSFDLKSTSEKPLRINSIKVTSQPCNYGGNRYYGCCPYCNGRVRKLYLFRDTFACRRCLRMAYPSQNKPLYLRLYRQEKEALERLEGDAWAKPKWMRQRTFKRLRNEYFDLKRMGNLADFMSLRTKKAAIQAMELYCDAIFVPMEVAMTQYGKYWNPCKHDFDEAWEKIEAKSKGKYKKGMPW